MSDGGKGSKPRPYAIPKVEFDNRWDLIFKQPKTEKIGDKVVQQIEESLQNGKDNSSQVS
jgi:hypothetical protein